MFASLALLVTGIRVIDYSFKSPRDRDLACRFFCVDEEYCCVDSRGHCVF